MGGREKRFTTYEAGKEYLKLRMLISSYTPTLHPYTNKKQIRKRRYALP